MTVKKILTVIELLLILLIAACAVFLGLYFNQSHETKVEMTAIKEQLPEEVDYTQYRDGIFDAYYDLYTQNEDFSGWLTVPGTPIDYPVMQADDNEFYLHRNFEKEKRYSGIPFADYQCDLYTPSTNIIIYAHNMKDGSMFASLSRYDEKSFYEQNKIITFNTIYARGEYEVIGAFNTTPEEFPYHEFINARNRGEFDEFIANVKRLSIYNTDSSASYGDHLLTLSTCAYNTDDERFVVVAKKINEN